MKQAIIFSLLIIILIISACTKKYYAPVNQNLKSSFNFKTGSYWIYRDSLTGREDSFSVRNNVDQYYLFRDNIYYEAIGLSICEYNLSTTKLNDTISWGMGYTQNVINLTYAINIIGIDYILYEPLINFPFQDTFTDGNYASVTYYKENAQVINTNTSLAINGINYLNLAIVYHEATISNIINASTYHYNDTFYICPSVGLVKIKLHHPQDSLIRIWELERYKIIK